jgi:RNA polymerase sigma factor (sigma-70 family)
VKVRQKNCRSAAVRAKWSQTKGVQLKHPDEQTLFRAARGDRQAFRQLYDAHVGFVQFIAGRFGFRGPEADDLVQEVFLVFYQSLSSIRDFGAIRAWLARTTKHRAIDCIRRRQRQPTNPAGDQLESIPDTYSAEEMIAREIDRLAAEQWLTEIANEPGGEVFKMFYVDGRSAREIALTTGEAVGTITARLSRLRQRFRSRLERTIEELGRQMRQK